MQEMNRERDIELRETYGFHAEWIGSFSYSGFGVSSAIFGSPSKETKVDSL